MFRGKDTSLLSETLVQVIFGVGLPSAIHTRVTESLSFTVLLLEMLMTTGVSMPDIKTIRMISRILMLAQIILNNVHRSKLLFGDLEKISNLITILTLNDLKIATLGASFTGYKP